MSIIKRGTCSSNVIVSESVYNCPDCGYVEMSEHIAEEEKMCPHCNIPMTLMSSSSHIEEDAEVVVEDAEEKDESKDEE